MIDLCIENGESVLKNDIDILLQEIETLFDTSKGQLFGNPYRATDFERFLYNLNISTTSIEDYIKNYIYQFCDTFDFDINVDAKAYKGTESDIIVVSIDIENDEYVANKTYRIG